MEGLGILQQINPVGQTLLHQKRSRNVHKKLQINVEVTSFYTQKHN